MVFFGLDDFMKLITELCIPYCKTVKNEAEDKIVKGSGNEQKHTKESQETVHI